MKRTSILSTTLLLAASLWGSSALAVNISLDPSEVGPITAGNTINVDIVASDLGENEVITTFDMGITFSGPLTLDAMTYSTALGDPACELFDDAGPCEVAAALFDHKYDPATMTYDLLEAPGVADPNLVSLLTDLTDILALQGAGWDGVLATLMFTANADAESTSFSLDWGGINDVKCNNARNPEDLDYVCFPQDTPVPEPGTMLLLSLGILGLGATRRRLRDRS